jgi:ABC-type antimicrobial peptide transport system permease subunit
MVVRTEGDPASFVPAVREAVGRFDPAQPIFDVQPLETRIADSIAVERFRAYWIGGFSAIALILVSVGLYGVLARLTALRVKEVGIRIALGAESRQVWTMVLGQGLKWTAAGAGIGLAVSIVAARYLESLLFGIGWSDPLTFGLVPVVLGLVSAIACSVPARRASRIEPADALRSE